MDRVVVASHQSYSLSSIPRVPSVIVRRRCRVVPPASRGNPMFHSNHNPVSSGLLKLPRINLGCKSTADSGENESKTVLDAFFLGKALGEVLTERIGSSVGEFLSVIGRMQAEQQKQVLEFQEEVLEKARQAKELASREVIISSAASSLSKPTDEDPFLQGMK